MDHIAQNVPNVLSNGSSDLPKCFLDLSTDTEEGKKTKKIYQPEEILAFMRSKADLVQEVTTSKAGHSEETAPDDHESGQLLIINNARTTNQRESASQSVGHSYKTAQSSLASYATAPSLPSQIYRSAGKTHPGRAQTSGMREIGKLLDMLTPSLGMYGPVRGSTIEIF
jgi:hypothetical protein